MRSKSTIKNTIFSLLEELVAIICAMILPRIILENFGSACNGLITSISQFLACAVLFRSGIGGATRAALYKPLADKDKNKIASIIKATDRFMKRVGLLLAFVIVILATIYPLFIGKEYDYLFTFTLFLIIGASTFAESFFGITYLIILQADQKVWVSSILKIVSYLLNIIFSVVLIKCGVSIHLVKLFSTIAFLVYPIGMNVYVRKKYNLRLKEYEPDNTAISQRWDAFWHQVSDFVTHNTDVVVLSMFTNLITVSIYSIYSVVIGAMKRLVASFAIGIESALGNMVAKKEKKLLDDNIGILEFIFYNLGTFVYTCGIILIGDFVAVYTKGINDANYNIPFFSYILMVAQFLTAIRMPYQQTIQAYGHYKQTKKYAIVEAGLNIVTSVLLVINFGLIGVAIGTLIALAYKTLMYIHYTSKHIANIKITKIAVKLIASLIEAVIIILICKAIKLPSPENYFDLALKGAIIAALSVTVICAGIPLVYKKECTSFIKKIRKKK